MSRVNIRYALSGLTIGIMFLLSSCQRNNAVATVPFTLDHNRMIVAAEIQRQQTAEGGHWHKNR